MSILRKVTPEIRKLQESEITFSGTVTSDNLPVSRWIGLFLGADKTLISSTKSDATTGAWSITITGTSFDKYDVECIGEPDERSISFSRVSGI